MEAQEPDNIKEFKQIEINEYFFIDHINIIEIIY